MTGEIKVICNQMVTDIMNHPVPEYPARGATIVGAFSFIVVVRVVRFFCKAKMLKLCYQGLAGATPLPGRNSWVCLAGTERYMAEYQVTDNFLLYPVLTGYEYPGHSKFKMTFHWLYNIMWCHRISSMYWRDVNNFLVQNMLVSINIFWQYIWLC